LYLVEPHLPKQQAQLLPLRRSQSSKSPAKQPLPLPEEASGLPSEASSMTPRCLALLEQAQAFPERAFPAAIARQVWIDEIQARVDALEEQGRYLESSQLTASMLEMLATLRAAAPSAREELPSWPQAWTEQVWQRCERLEADGNHLAAAQLTSTVLEALSRIDGGGAPPCADNELGETEHKTGKRLTVPTRPFWMLRQTRATPSPHSSSNATRICQRV